MTEWQAMQWFTAGVGALTGLGSLGWILTQGRKLHREERERARLESAAAALVDLLAERGYSGAHEVKPEQPRAAALAEEWGALVTIWDRGRMLVRLATLNDPK